MSQSHSLLNDQPEQEENIIEIGNAPREASPTFMQQFVDRHPYLFAFYHLAKGKFAAAHAQPIPVKSTFKDYKFNDEHGQCVAQLTHYDGKFPVIEMFTADSHVNAKAHAKFMATYLIQLQIQYTQYLPLNNLYHSPPSDVDAFTSDEVQQRQTNTYYLNEHLHYLLKEYNACVAEYNQDASILLKLNYLTMQTLRELLCQPELYRNINISAAIDEHDAAFTCQLDSTSLGILGNHALGVLTRTHHKQASKPKSVFSIGFTPGLSGFIMANDKGLVLARHETTKADARHISTVENAQPPGALIKRIIEDCVTIDDIAVYLSRYPANASFQLSARDAGGNAGVFEVLPHDDDNEDARFHFKTLHENKLPCTNDTLQKYIFTHDEHGLTVDISVADNHQGQLLDEDQDMMKHHVTINLSQAFEDLLAKAPKNKQRMTSALKKESEQSRPPVDDKLISLLDCAHKLFPNNHTLAVDISNVYSWLALELTKHRFETLAHEMAEEDIYDVAHYTIKLLKDLVNNTDIVKVNHLFRRHKAFIDQATKKMPVDSFQLYGTMLFQLFMGAGIGCLLTPYFQECAVISWRAPFEIICRGKSFDMIASTFINALVGGCTGVVTPSIFKEPGLTLFNDSLMMPLCNVIAENIRNRENSINDHSEHSSDSDKVSDEMPDNQLTRRYR